MGYRTFHLSQHGGYVVSFWISTGKEDPQEIRLRVVLCISHLFMPVELILYFVEHIHANLISVLDVFNFKKSRLVGHKRCKKGSTQSRANGIKIVLKRRSASYLNAPPPFGCP